ncbi:MAG: prepilin-type N-terminal cleavage/methylation domain-containing protein [Tenacibaculum sp.]
MPVNFLIKTANDKNNEFRLALDMYISKKTKAFTLSEVLVVLIVSSIVVSLTFAVLFAVQKQIKLIQTNLVAKQQIQFIERMLWKDFNSYTTSYDLNTSVLYFKNSVDSLIYEFKSHYIIRKNDTLAFEIAKKQLFLDGEEVVTGNIDAIKLQTSAVFGNKKIFVFKSKDASFYLNN